MDRRSVKYSRNDGSKLSMSANHAQTTGNSPNRRKIGHDKPVFETFLNPANDDKFCLPCTLSTARQIEFDLERIKKDLKEVRKCRKKLNKKAMLESK